MKIITEFVLDRDLNVISETSYDYDGPVALAKGGGSTTTTVQQTPEQQEADRLRLAEMQRQNDLAAAMLPGQQALIEQQRQILQYQIDHQGELDSLHTAQLEQARLQIQQQIADSAMQEQLRPEQLKYLQNQNELAIQQIQSLKKTGDYQDQANTYTLAQMKDANDRLVARQQAYSPQEEATAAADEARRATRMSAMSEEAANIQLANLKQGTKPTDEQLSNINQAYDASQQYGESEISRNLTQTLRQINEEVSQASGLRPTDSPSLALSTRAGEEAQRQSGQLTTSIEGQRAQARLNYPLAASQLAGNQAATLQGITSNAANFQDQLRLAAATNRQQAFQLPSSMGFAMPQQYGQTNTSFMNPGGGGYNPGAFGLNLGGGGQTTTSQVPWWTPLQAVGQAAQGVGSLVAAGSSMFSDIRLKTDVKRVGRTDAGLPVYTYRYKGDATPRLGVMAQEAARLFPEAVHRDKSGYLTVEYARIE